VKPPALPLVLPLLVLPVPVLLPDDGSCGGGGSFAERVVPDVVRVDACCVVVELCLLELPQPASKRAAHAARNAGRIVRGGRCTALP
jgi:hypothetical protein